MRHWRKYLLLLAFVLPIGALVVVLIPSPEPEYGGKKLSGWIGTRYWSPQPGFPDQTISWFPSKTEDALRNMGTNAIPYLLQWAEYDSAPWRRNFYRGVNSALQTINPYWRIDDKKTDRAEDALIALGEMEFQAAFPHLMTHSNSRMRILATNFFTWPGKSHRQIDPAALERATR